MQNHAIQRRLFSAQRSVALRIVSAYKNCLGNCCVGPSKRSANRFIGGGKAGDLSAPQGAYLYRPAGNHSCKGGHPQGWKAQTRRVMADEMAWCADWEMDLLPDPGARHLAEQKARGSRLLFGASTLRPWLF